MRAEKQPLPPDTRINVRYGANQDGEPYALGEPSSPQAVRCTEDSSPGGAASVEPEMAGAGGTTDSGDVWALRCLLYTQGPADVDVTATGMEPIMGEALSLDRKHRCNVKYDLTLEPLKPDAGM